MSEFTPDGRYTQFNLTGTGYYGYRKGELGSYEYIAYKKNAKGECRELAVDVSGMVKITLPTGRQSFLKEKLVCMLMRIGGTYSDRISISEPGLLNYETLPNGEIRNKDFPDRVLPVRAGGVYHLFNNVTRLDEYVNGVIARITYDTALNCFSKGIRINEIKQLALSTRIKKAWKQPGRRPRILMSDFAWIPEHVPQLREPELIDGNPSLCVDVSSDGDIGTTLFHVIYGTEYPLVMAGTNSVYVAEQYNFVTNMHEAVLYEYFTLNSKQKLARG